MFSMFILSWREGLPGCLQMRESVCPAHPLERATEYQSLNPPAMHAEDHMLGVPDPSAIQPFAARALLLSITPTSS